jgi:hypothetical protein
MQSLAVRKNRRFSTKLPFTFDYLVFAFNISVLLRIALVLAGQPPFARVSTPALAGTRGKRIAFHPGQMVY